MTPTEPRVALEIITPTIERLPDFVDALERGWSPDNTRGPATIGELSRQIAADPAAFLAAQDDPDARAGPVTLPDGSTAPRLPGFHRWLWDGDFCGVIGFRWQRGTSTLPAHVMGHVGYAVVPWKRRRGYATAALALLLPEVRALGLAYVELTCDPDNLASQKVIAANGGRFVERFTKPPAFGGVEALRFRIVL